MKRGEMVIKNRGDYLIRNRKGQTVIEFALIAILLCGLVFAIVDFGYMFYVNLTIQHAVREGARYAITGGSDGSCGGTVRSCAVAKIRSSSVGLCDKNPCNITFYTMQSGSPVELPTDPNDPGSSVVGGPQELIVIRVAYSWPLLTPIVKPFFPDGKYNFTVGATMRNEPFEESGA
jgi:Flp pilus assembly protein TadG